MAEKQRDTRGVDLIERESCPPELRWTDDPSLWCRLHATRYASTGKQLARMFIVFIRALVAVVVSHRADPAFRTSCEQMISEWQEERDAAPSARVPMRAIIRSMRLCGKGVFLHTLYTLLWAGHIRTMGTFTALRFVFNSTVQLCLEDMDYYGQTDENYVRFHSSVYMIVRAETVHAISKHMCLWL